jgi:hypothetical protein
MACVFAGRCIYRADFGLTVTLINARHSTPYRELLTRELKHKQVHLL